MRREGGEHYDVIKKKSTVSQHFFNIINPKKGEKPMTKNYFFWITRFSLLLFVLAQPSIALAVPVNPGFEDGLNGYTTTGNAQVLSGLGSLSPTEGNSFVLLSTGPFDVGGDGLPDSSSILSNAFTLESDADLLTFDFNFLTEEFTGSNALAFDFFETYLVTSTGTELITSMDTTYTGFYSIDGGTPVVAPDGSLFLDQTGFMSVAYDVSGYSGMDVALQFSVSDEWDGSFDSGLLIDNIDVTTQSAPVPEPATLFLLGSGLIGLAGFQRKNLLKRVLKNRTIQGGE